MKTSTDRHKCNRHTSPLGLVAKGEGGGWALVKASENGQKIGQKVPPPDPTLYPLTYPILQILLQTPHGHVLHTTIGKILIHAQDPRILGSLNPRILNPRIVES